MRKIIFILITVLFFFSCKKENAKEENHVQNEMTDSTTPVVVLNSPIENSVFHNGDTLFISGSVSDNELHGGTVILKNDTSSLVYLNQYHNVHGLSTATINFFYVVNGITQNESVKLTASYEDHTPNYSVQTIQLYFQP